MSITNHTNRVVHFEIAVDDPARAIAFYEAVFGWKFQKWESDTMEYWMVMTAPQESTAPGINGGLFRRQQPKAPEGSAANAFTCVIEVTDFDAVAQKIIDADGAVAVPKSALPGMAWTGYFMDTEGNNFGLYQEDSNAK